MHFYLTILISLINIYYEFFFSFFYLSILQKIGLYVFIKNMLEGLILFFLTKHDNEI